MIPILEKLENRFKFDKPIIVADAGLLSTDNINLLTRKGYSYILGARIKNEAKRIKNQIEKVDYDKYESDCKWDGLKGCITNTDLDGKQERS